jgi:hypothetical protein
MTDLDQYLNDKITVEVDCTDHKHEVEVVVTSVALDDLQVDAQGDLGFCSQRDCFTGWMRPSTEITGVSKPPLVGTDDDGFGLAQL